MSFVYQLCRESKRIFFKTPEKYERICEKVTERSKYGEVYHELVSSTSAPIDLSFYGYHKSCYFLLVSEENVNKLKNILENLSSSSSDARKRLQILL
mgnify:CR=1 FL=1